jgi:hypothetical protein
VELEETAKHCALCRAALPHVQQRQEPSMGAEISNYPDKALDPEDFEGFTAEEKRKIFIEVFSVCSLIACFVVLSIEFLLAKRLWWSLYPVSSIAYVYVLVCIPMFLQRRPWMVFAILAPATLAFVFLIDLITNGLSWFPTLGLPITLLIEGVVLSCVVLSSVSKRKGVNVIAISLLGVAAICAGIEIVLNLNFVGRFFLSWSAVAVTVCLPISGFLFYLHYRIIKRASLKKLFRL